MKKFTAEPPIRTHNYQAMLMGALVVYLVSIAGSAIIAFVLNNTSITEDFMPLMAQFTFTLSTFLGGLWTGRKAQGAGLIHGASAVFFSILPLSVILFLEKPASVADLLYKMLLGLAAGAVGGIIGVNL